MNPKIFAVILTWNNYSDTRNAIESLIKSTLPPDGITVVDNASIDGSIERLKKHYENKKHIHFIQNPKNYGFAKGINVGIRHALTFGAEYVLLLNDDAIADIKCIEKLHSAIHNEPLIGIVGPRIFYYGEPNKIWHGGGYFGLLRTGPKIREKNCSLANCRPYKRRVSFLTGCTLLIKREVFEKIGLFDEDYFLYGEDLDLCWRAARQGFRIMYVPEAQAWHKISSNLKDRVSPLVMYHMARSRIIFLRKNLPFSFLIYAFIVHFVAYTPFRIIQSFKSDKPRMSIWAWIRGTLDGLSKRLIRRPKVVICGWYGGLNWGDEAILKGLLYLLRKSEKERILDITVVSANPHMTKQLHKVDSVKKVSTKVLKKVFVSDWLVIGGGGLFPGSLKGCLYRLLLIAIAKLRNRRVSILGVGVGSVRSGLIKLQLIRFLFVLADDIIVRDRHSLETIRNLLVSKVSLGSDFALAAWVGHRTIAPTQYQTHPIVIGVTLKGSLCTQEHHEKRRNFAEQLLEYVAKSRVPIRVDFITSCRNDDDTFVAHNMSRLFERNMEVSFTEPDTLEEWETNIVRCKLLVTERLHPALLATSQMIPVMVICSETKLSPWISCLGLEENFASILKNLEEKSFLAARFNKAMEQEEILAGQFNDIAIKALGKIVAS